MTDAEGRILQAFHDADMADLWYAHPGGAEHNRFGERWHAGVWTGPDRDLLCVRRTESAEEAELLLSPGADDPFSAMASALDLLAKAGPVRT